MVKEKFNGKNHSRENVKGVLFGKLTSYQDCFELNRSNLNGLLESDEKEWKRNLLLTKKNLAEKT